jgi:hypothetical protein
MTTDREIIPLVPGQSVEAVMQMMTDDFKYLKAKSWDILSEPRHYCTTLSGWIKREWWKRWWHEDRQMWVEHDTFKDFVEDGGRMGLSFDVSRQGDHIKALVRAGIPGALEIATEWLGVEQEAGLGLDSHGGDRSPDESPPPDDGVQGDDVILKTQGRDSTLRQDRSNTYTLRRFIRDIADEKQPEERRQQLQGLLDEVKAERLSVNQAAIKAGYRKKPRPKDQVIAFLKKCTDEEKIEIFEMLEAELASSRF